MTYIIAEAGVNHNGSLQLAKELIDVATEAGADAVKFQTFKSGNLLTKFAPKAEYQKNHTDQSESQFEMLRKLELSEENHIELINHCKKNKIDFLSTPFDLESLNLLARTFQLPTIKLPSGEITNATLLLEAARTGASLILSTGMSTIGEVEAALGVLAFGYLAAERSEMKPSLEAFQAAYLDEQGRKAIQEKVSLLHCTTEYPAPFQDVNLLVMDTMKNTFQLPVGYSDHTEGIAVSLAAVARGASIIEKHFTLDRSLPGPDHQCSLEPEELKLMITSIRQIEQALGSSIKGPAASELSNRAVARRSIVAAVNIEQGELFTLNNLTVKRPGVGLSPFYLWECIGKPAPKKFQADELISL